MIDRIGKTTDIRSGSWSYVLDEPARILVVDDDPILREFASVYLATPTATIDTAEDGSVALERLAGGDYDAVLVDIEMPRLNGFALLERMRADRRLRDTPAIMLTGHDDIGSIDRAYQVGATAFATKPVNWRQLSYQIRYVLRHRRLRAGAPSWPWPRPAELANDDTLRSLQAVVAHLDAAAAAPPGDEARRLAEIASASTLAMQVITALEQGGTATAAVAQASREIKDAALS